MEHATPSIGGGPSGTGSALSGADPRHLGRLEDLLCRELDGYRDLLDVMLKEKELLTANQPQTLPDILDEQRRILEGIRALEPDRERALRALAEELGCAGRPTLGELATRLDGSARIRVTRLREALRHVVPRVDQVNRINVLLIRNSMSFISETVRAILDEASPRAATYASGGHLSRTEPAAGWTDRRI